MPNKIYYFSYFSEHDALFSLAQKAKHTMQQNDTVNKIYQKIFQELYGQSSGHDVYLMKLATQSIVSNCLRDFCSSPVRESVSTSPEIKNESTSTPVIKNRNLLAMRRTNLLFDNAGNEASQSVTSSPGKQSTPTKLVPSAKESDSLWQEHLTVNSADKEGSPSVSRNRRKQLNPVKKNQNSPEFENSPHKCLPLGHKEMDKTDAVNLESHNVRRQTVITEFPYKCLHPGRKEMDKTEVVNLESHNVRRQTVITEAPHECLPLGRKEMDKTEVVNFESLNVRRQTVITEVPHKCLSLGHKEIDKAVAVNLESPNVRSQTVFSESLHECLPLGHKEMDKTEAVNLESHNLRRQTVIAKAIMSPKENCEAISYSVHLVSPNAQDTVNIGNLQADKRQLEKSGKIFEKSATLTINVVENASLSKEIRVGESTTGDDKNISSEKKATTSDNRKFVGSAEETRLGTLLREGAKEYFDFVKISGNPVAITQDPTCSVDETEMQVYSTESCKKDISPTQVSNLFKISGKNKKSPSPSTNKGLFSFLPKFLIHSCGVGETEAVSYLVVDNLSPTVSPISLPEYKSMYTGKGIIDQDKSRKDVNFYEKESKAGSSTDTSPSEKSSSSSNTYKNYGKFKNYWKSTSLQEEEEEEEDTIMPSSSAPRTIQPSGALEIGTDTSCLPAENFIPTTSPVSSADYKINEDWTDNIDKNNLPEENNFSQHTESKAGSSRDISPLKTTSLVSSPLDESNSSPISDDFWPGNDSYELFNESPPTNHSSKSVSFPEIHDLDVNALTYCIKELTTVVSLREQSMKLFYDSLLIFRKDVEFLITYIMDILHIVQNISTVNKDHATEEDKYFPAIIQLGENLSKKYNLLDSDLQVYIQFWDECLQQIHEIKSRNEPFLSNDLPLVTIVILQAYEEELKTKWKQLDDTISFLDDRKTLFLATAEYLETFVNLLVKCFITIGILKPLTPML